MGKYPERKTLANRFNLISLIGLLSYETLYSLVFIVLFYLVILLFGGIFVYLSQDEISKISAIVSLLLNLKIIYLNHCHSLYWIRQRLLIILINSIITIIYISSIISILILLAS